MCIVTCTPVHSCTLFTLQADMGGLIELKLQLAEANAKLANE